MKKVLSVPDRSTPKGKRDYVMLRLMWDNALRRGEVVSADVRHFDRVARILWVRSKGKSSHSDATLAERADGLWQ